MLSRILWGNKETWQFSTKKCQVCENSMENLKLNDLMEEKHDGKMSPKFDGWISDHWIGICAYLPIISLKNILNSFLRFLRLHTFDNNIIFIDIF